MKGTLTDSGPLYALIDRDDAYHKSAVQGLESIELPMLTTWPCLTEAMHFLRKTLGWPGQQALLEMARQGDLVVLDSAFHGVSAVTALMETYSDAPMDLADGSLVAAATALSRLDIFSFDGHFNAYRVQRRRQFRLVP
jgi:predicted nucleic acid-binding protein